MFASSTNSDLAGRRPGQQENRRGVLTIWLVVGMVVCLACLGLALNSGMLAKTRLRTDQATQAAALAAAQAVLTDDLLKEDLLPMAVELRDQRARAAALSIYEQYRRESGLPLIGEQNVVIGRMLKSPGEEQQTLFAQQVTRPETVHVLATNNAATDYSGAMMLANVSGVRKGKVASLATVRLRNRVKGFRFKAGKPLPLLPVVVTDSPQTPQPGSWTWEIERRRGSDNLAWDDVEKTVLEGEDGLSEIELDLSKSSSLISLAALRQSLFAADDASAGGTLSLPTDVVPAGDDEIRQLKQLLQSQIGQPQLLLLADEPTADAGDDAEDNSQSKTLRLTRAVAARVMSVDRREGSLWVVLQPCVLSLPGALMSDDAGVPENSYIWQLQLMSQR